MKGPLHLTQAVALRISDSFFKKSILFPPYSGFGHFWIINSAALDALLHKHQGVWVNKFTG